MQWLDTLVTMHIDLQAIQREPACQLGLLLAHGQARHLCVQVCEEINGLCPLYLIFLVIDCGNPPDIPNGVVTVSGTSLDSTAQYSCNDGYMLLGGATRTCQSTEMWSGTEPACVRKCVFHTFKNF